MSKNKLLILAVVALISINIVTLSFFISKRPKDRDEKAMPREIVIEKLHFDADQIHKYDALIKTHKETIVRLDDQIKDYKNNLYKELANSENKKNAASLLLQIDSLHSSIEKTHYNHFLGIKKLCRQDQIKEFNKLTGELAKIFRIKLPSNQKKHEH